MEALCQTYWQPLYAYIRHQGSGPDEASDLTQAFFTELLEKRVLDGVDPSKGRFRAFLLGTLRHFLSHERERARALKRGGGTVTVSLDLDAAEQAYALGQATAAMTPEDVFEQRWTMIVLGQAMERLEREMAGTRRESQFEVLKQYLTSSGEQVPYREAAQLLEMREGAVKTAVHRLRRRYGDCLRAEIAETVADPEEVDGEVRHLLTVVRG